MLRGLPLPSVDVSRVGITMGDVAVISPSEVIEMAAELPNCARCRTRVQSGQNVVFRPDGRVEHAECPRVVCVVCERDIRPHDPIRRDSDQLLHGNCWIRRFRATTRESS